MDFAEEGPKPSPKPLALQLSGFPHLPPSATNPVVASEEVRRIDKCTPDPMTSLSYRPYTGPAVLHCTSSPGWPLPTESAHTAYRHQTELVPIPELSLQTKELGHPLPTFPTDRDLAIYHWYQGRQIAGLHRYGAGGAQS